MNNVHRLVELSMWIAAAEQAPEPPPLREQLRSFLRRADGGRTIEEIVGEFCDVTGDDAWQVSREDFGDALRSVSDIRVVGSQCAFVAKA